MPISKLISDFDALVSDTHTLCVALRKNTFKLWVPLSDIDEQLGLTAIDKVCNSLQDFWYQDGQDGRETRSSFGLVPATPEQIDLAIKINGQKERFKTCIKTLQKSNKEDWLTLKGQLGRAHPTLRQSLRYSGLSRLHIKQTWRHIPVIERTPIRAGFNW
jgi:hypothetical protein